MLAFTYILNVDVELCWRSSSSPSRSAINSISRSCLTRYHSQVGAPPPIRTATHHELELGETTGHSFVALPAVASPTRAAEVTQLTCVYIMQHTGETERMCDMTCASTCRATRMSGLLTSETTVTASRIQNFNPESRKCVRVHGTAKPRHCHCHCLAWNSSCHLIPSFVFLALFLPSLLKNLALRNIRRFLPVAPPGQSTLPEVLRGSSTMSSMGGCALCSNGSPAGAPT
ncbi:hypothetical protein C8Q74DRAFT_427715 [Fomes fomentarius]|nr:hypothetical protein C8Q74DRAFT_427715 [Fomes fomentarius]